VNRVNVPRLPAPSVTAASEGRVDAERLRGELTAAGLDVDDEVLDGLVEQTVEHALRVRMEERAKEKLAESDLPTLELPELTDGVDVAALYELAEVLVGRGVR
jgi:hypothetical protein